MSGTLKVLLGVVILVGAIICIALIYLNNEPTKYINNTNNTQVSSSEEFVKCNSIPNNEIKEVNETTRIFINLPRDLYNFETAKFVTSSGTATGGYISNGGPIGYSSESSNDCWSTYYELDGKGETVFSVQAKDVKILENYNVRFIVK